jgi:hypothetical protein
MADNISLVFGSAFLASLSPISITINSSIVSDTVTILGRGATGADGVESGTPLLADGHMVVDNTLLVSSTSEGGEAALKSASVLEQFVSTEAESSRKENSAHLSTANSKDAVHTPAAAECQCSITGYVSKAGLGVGRSDNDRQFVFCNSRPVDMPKFIKIMNEVSERADMSP